MTGPSENTGPTDPGSQKHTSTNRDLATGDGAAGSANFDTGGTAVMLDPSRPVDAAVLQFYRNICTTVTRGEDLEDLSSLDWNGGDIVELVLQFLEHVGIDHTRPLDGV